MTARDSNRTGKINKKQKNINRNSVPDLHDVKQDKHENSNKKEEPAKTAEL